MGRDEEVLRFGPRTVELSSPDKVLYPEAGHTKRDVVEYYRTVSAPLVAHAGERPLTLQRFPDGVSEEGFYQKEIPDGFPDWVPRVEVTLEDGTAQDQVLVDGPSVLALLAQHAVLTMHVWTSRAAGLERPDRMVFDLDPGEGSFADVRTAAGRLRERLEGVGLTPHPMLTGSSGMHVWVPIRRGPGFDDVRSFARQGADRRRSLCPPRSARCSGGDTSRVGRALGHRGCRTLYPPVGATPTRAARRSVEGNRTPRGGSLDRSRRVGPATSLTRSTRGGLSRIRSVKCRRVGVRRVEPLHLIHAEPRRPHAGPPSRIRPHGWSACCTAEGPSEKASLDHGVDHARQ